MSQSYIAHYKNKYPKGQVKASDSSLDVWDRDGEHVVALRKDGAGQWKCVSKEVGARDEHDLSPIPKEARVHKLYKDGRIAPSEEAAERKEHASKLADEHGGKIPSIDEIEALKKAAAQA